VTEIDNDNIGDMNSRTRIFADSKEAALTAIVAALYVVLTWVVAPIAYGPIQFRVSEGLKGSVIKKKVLIVSFIIGNALSNIFSPQAGIWEFVWMPFWNLIGGGACYLIANKLSYNFSYKDVDYNLFYFAGSFAYALCIAFAVAFMLAFLFAIPFWILFPFLLLSEAVLIVGLTPVMTRIMNEIEW
jgi:uncharacterized membrane protein